MTMFTFFKSLRDRLDMVIDLLFALLEEQKIMQERLEELRAEVERAKSVNASVKTLIEGMAARLEAAADDPEEVAAIIQDLRSSTDEIAAAVEANPQK
ncbi:MAG TPA: hypothetical protein VGU45_05045 [Microvirga sp.]|jgi:cell division septum initiation protein DivIVA|nr:hypothetical protein [Microvirga sp.]